MVQKRFALVALLFVASCASAEHPERQNVMSYGCDDLVLIGRVTTVASEEIPDPRSLLGHSVWDTEITIKRIIRGAERKRTVRATGVSHAQIRDDIDMLIVLSKPEGGRGYTIQTLNVVGLSRLADRCTETPENNL